MTDLLSFTKSNEFMQLKFHFETTQNIDEMHISRKGVGANKAVIWHIVETRINENFNSEI